MGTPPFVCPKPSIPPDGTSPGRRVASLDSKQAKAGRLCSDWWTGTPDLNDEQADAGPRPIEHPWTAAERVLVIEDDPLVRSSLRLVLEHHGLTVLESGSVGESVAVFVRESPDVVVLDYLLPDGHALDLLPRFLDIDPDVPTVIITGHGSIELAVRATKAGAANFLTKPVDPEALMVVIARLLDQSRNRRRKLAQQSGTSRRAPNPFLGRSPLVRRLEEEAKRYLHTSSPILVEGETGVGKGFLARWIHDNGSRAQEPFVDINCAGLTSAFLEAELFGHTKGAFTGAAAAKPGLLEVADHGTAFLDEVADVDVQIQPKLLKVVEEKRFRRLGEVTDRTTDVRLVAATNRDLGRIVAAGRFREDLFFRVSVLPLRIPPLRARAEDIPFIAQVILRRVAADLGRPEVYLNQSALDTLQAYSWPGNLRELRNTLERAVLLSDRNAIGPELLHLGRAPRDEGTMEDTHLSLEEVERRHIARVLADVGGNVGLASARLDVPRSTLYKKLKRIGQDLDL